MTSKQPLTALIVEDNAFMATVLHDFAPATCKRLDDLHFQTIFTTSHSHYAIKAFRSNALDYLVKPIKETELKEAIHRIGKTKTNSDVSLALQNLGTKTVEEQKLVLPTQIGTLRFCIKTNYPH